MGHVCQQFHVTLAAVCMLLWSSAGAQTVRRIFPYVGSVNGGTRLTIEGEDLFQKMTITYMSVWMVFQFLQVKCVMATGGGGGGGTATAGSRAYMGGMPCELLKPNSDEKYGLKLDYVNSQWGYMSCKMTGTYVGHHNLSYILGGEYGRSLPDLGVLSVSALNKLAMFQTYAEVTGVSPSEGSILGGTLLTIQGHYFDETDRPAVVLVGGHKCQIRNISDDKIVCMTPGYEKNNLTVFPGSRGIQLEMWNDTYTGSLEDVLTYNASRPGYSVQRLDSLSYVWPTGVHNVVARLRGFIVPTETDNYYFIINGYSYSMLYFSKTGLPKDKVRIEFHRREVMRLEKGKPYYIEVVVQGYYYYYQASVDVGFFKDISPFTAQQTTEAVQEKQKIIASYDVLPERQEVSFKGWTSVSAVQDVQTLRICSDCLSMGFCDNTYYFLAYGDHRTGPIPVSASALDLQNALNELRGIQPDTVTVTKEELSNEAHYNVTFNSNRGDFEDLKYLTMGSDVNITVTERVKGKASLETFTLLWDGVSSPPLTYDASESEVLDAINVMLSAKCPAQIPTTENTNVKYFRDYEDGRALCLAYKGRLANQVGMYFSYQSSDYGYYNQMNIQISVQFDSTDEWKYKCVDLVDSIPQNIKGFNYNLYWLTVSGESANSVYFIDTVHIGRAVTALDPSVIMQRSPPALGSSGPFFSSIYVNKRASASQISYEITATPYYCGFGIPLLEIGFLEKMPNSTEDKLVQCQNNATVTISRVHKASPPLTGTFDVEIYGRHVEGLPVNISDVDLQYALQGIPELGQLKVYRYGDCRGYTWDIWWLTIDSSAVVGVNPSVTSQEIEQGGIFKRKITGDFLRIPTDKPQVEVFINGIPSWCSGDCSFTWSESKTPTVTRVSPTEGSSGLATVVNITGSGFDGSSVTVKTGEVECSVQEVTSSYITCEVGPASAGIRPMSLSFSGLGIARYQNDSSFNFTHLLGVTSIYPTIGSEAGGAILTVSGYGFSIDTSVTIGSQQCNVIEAEFTHLRCIVPAGSSGEQTVTVTMGEITATSTESFTYDNTLMATITAVSPHTTTVFGFRILTIIGTNFKELVNGSSVLVGETECKLLKWTNENITCMLPKLAPAVYDIRVRVGNRGFAKNSAGVNTTIEFVLKVTGFSPPMGSLYGGTTITISGSGFSSVPSENNVTLVYGQGYAWSPSAPIVSVGDTVVWSWEAPAFVSDLGYRVFSVSSLSSTDHDNEGIVFNSGDNKTAKGFFSHRFTSPGVYYYSSGFIDSYNQKTLQGVVTVRPLEERTVGLQVSVAGIQASVNLASRQMNSSESECVAISDCVRDQQELNGTSNGLYFSFTSCSSPTVENITPNHGTSHDIITIQGSGFSNIACANEVKVGGHLCRIISSTSTDINCKLSPDLGTPVGTPLPITMRVNNLGTAIMTMLKEYDRRFVVLPVVDSVSPSVGSTTGFTRLFISGSGFVNASSVTPVVSSVSPDSVTGNSTTVVVTGSGFGSNKADLKVSADDIILEVTQITDNIITLLVGALPAGEHALWLVVMSKGLSTGLFNLTSTPQATIQPTSGSIAGGTPLLIEGNGFVVDYTTVMFDYLPCQILEVTPDRVKCLTPPHTEGEVLVNIWMYDVEYPQQSFYYTVEQTPDIISVSPATGPVGTQITISGSGFGTDAALVSVEIDAVGCNVTSITDTQLMCTVGEHAGGTFPVLLYHQVKGHALSQSVFSYELLLTGVTPNEGSYAGGAVVAIRGSGFDPNSTRILICDRECNVDLKTSTSNQLYCEVPHNNGNETEQVCMVSVTNGNDTVSITTGYTYRSSLTPVITDVTPRRGGTAGGTRLTITGSGFSTNTDQVNVTIAGSVCDVQSANETKIICVTNDQPKSQETKVRVLIGNRGIARMDRADFFYIDVWSSPYTWGGLSPPEEGTFAVITAGQTILLDTSTPVLKMLLIKGGRLIFDEADIELQAENILITDGGALQIGTEQQPFQHKAIITLHGHLRSKELPVYGAKTLGVREGVLDLHGIPVPVTWTRLSQTAQNGSSTLTLMDAVTWKAGDEIVIASTGNRHSQRENELRKIASASDDGRTLNLTEPLTYTHLGLSVNLPDGTVFEARAEVGLLTRNIVIRGSNNQEWNDQIPACPDGFNTGEFAVQTCFQGRFGEEEGSDEFGGCIMFHPPQPNQNLAIGRIEYVEMFHAGQAFRLGRHPINWQLMGDVGNKSYMRGCTIHQSYNRAVTIHRTHNLLVEHNVIYDIKGGAFFITDGNETGNILQYNLAVFVRQSTSLQNDDVTPAAFWVTNPNNTIRHNTAAGGTHFGFWYNMKDPDIQTYDTFCQKKVPLGQFFNNTVHSQGWFGLWIFHEYLPTQNGLCYYSTPKPVVFRRLTSWNNEKGAEWVNVGAVQFSEFLMVNNEKAGVEAKRIFREHVSGWGLEEGAAVVNSTIVGHVSELGNDYCTTHGIVLPLDDGMSVINTKFMSFNKSSCAAVGVAEITETCTYHCGGWSARFSGIQYYQSPNKARFRWEHEVALIDIDGSLTGSSMLNYADGWVALVPSGQTYNWEFERGSQISSLSYSGTIYGFKQEDYIILNHNFTQAPDAFHIIDSRKGSSESLDPSVNVNGDWYFNDLTNSVYYLVSGRDHVASRRRRNSVDRSLLDRYINFFSYQCYYPKCIQPTQPPPRPTSPTGPTGPSGPIVTPDPNGGSVPSEPQGPLPSPNPNTDNGCTLWSNELFWLSSPENNFAVPKTGSDVVIPSGKCVIVDIAIPSLNKLTIFGVLEIPDENNGTANIGGSQYNNVVLNVTYISIQGGYLRVGWSDQPFRGELKIILKGNHLTPDWELPGINQGSKVLGVFGSLDLFGMPHNVYHTKLARTVEAGNNTISLVEAVDWKVGHKILLSTTSYDPWQTEIRTITAVSDDGRTLILDQPVTYTHIGQRYNVTGSSRSYQLAGNVGLLTRNIKIIGQEYPEMKKQSYGARVLVGTFIQSGFYYRGNARIRDVEFYRTGQEGWNDPSDPRYSLAFLNLGNVAVESYIKGCAFHDGFAPAIGVFGTDGLNIEDSIIHRTVGEGIRIWGDNNAVRRNLVTLTLWPGSYNGAAESTNIEWNAAIEVSMNVLISNVNLVDNGMGIMPIIYKPPSISHEYEDKSVRVQESLIVGSRPDFNCLDTLVKTKTYVSLSASHRAPRPPKGGRSGICWPTFESEHNQAPQKPHAGIMSYNAIAGLLTVSDTTFVGFKNVCSTERNYMFMSNPRNEDLQHPISVERITKIDSTEESLAFIHNPDLSKVNPSDCVDMDCDAKKKTMLKDLDGSFLGAVGAVVPYSEYEWNGDPRHGLGDYRIPKVMLTALNGSRIPVSQIAPNKGVIRDSCTYMSTWQSYKCFGLNYKMLVIESLDADTETRRLSPVAILGDTYVDLLNGPQDHSWCTGNACRRRVSLFHAIVATNKSFDIFFTSTTPQKMRLMTLDTKLTEAVRVGIFYSSSQRLDVYVNNNFVAPTNAQGNSGNTEYTPLEPTYPGQYLPSYNSDHGSNFYDPDYKMLYVLLRGSEPVQIRTSPVLFLAFNLPAMTEAEFFGPDLIRNLAAFLKVPQNMIRITKIIREGSSARRQRSTGLTVEIEISLPPVQTFSTNTTNNINSTDSTNNTTGTTVEDNDEQFVILKNAANELGRAAVSGILSESIGFNVSSLELIPPPPSSSDPSWSEVATQEVTREDQQVESVKTVSSLLMAVQPVAGLNPGPLSVQPSIMAVDAEGNCVSVGVTSLTISAVLKDANGNLVQGLSGNTTILFSGCWANYTDLSILTSGVNLKLAFTLTEWSTESRSFTVNAVTTPTIQPTPEVVPTDDDSSGIFDSSPSFSSSSMCLLMLLTAFLFLFGEI
ncbi:Fibrocystin-L Polycystic kidney and hepatic disease 1-like protein 1 [Triplophysa tibetana]|uniref:Fibrocystin-L Polycystic kidney and hepatic disease 1-like protein 1 n=1 Tax=Triplophysa tibetana TaxID=1572043 RepID=A0A5A9NMM1_9TELE|nr:Fibrocystin-L Polycystic kidney and hepatic disease 1-like protein 1 [Triplophysa tibetana]